MTAPLKTSARRGVFGHALIFGLAPILQRLAGLVLLPLYTHYLSPAQYGEIELLTIASGLVAMVLRLELRPGYLRAWIDSDDAARPGLARKAARLLAALGLAGAAGAFLVSAPACRWLAGHEVGLGIRILLALGILLEVASLIPQATMQAQLRSRAMVAIGLAQFVLGAGLTVVCVTLLDLGPFGVFLGGVAGQALGLVAMTALVRFPAAPAAPTQVAPLLRYSLPLLGGALLFFVVRNADRLIVARALSVPDLGEYALGWSLANLLMTMIFLPLQSSLDVWRHRMFRQTRGAADFAEIYRIALLVMGLAAVGLNTAGLDLFVHVADDRFASAVALAPALSLAVLLQVGYSIVASAFFVTGATARWTAIFAVGAALQVGVSLVCVPRLGLAGAPLGVLAANAWLYAAAAIWGRREWAVPYQHSVMAVVLLILPAACLLRRALPALPIEAALPIDAVILLLALAALFGAQAAAPRRRPSPVATGPHPPGRLMRPPVWAARTGPQGPGRTTGRPDGGG